MATEPINSIIRIAENDTTLPSTGLTNKLEPITSVKQTGFDANILLSAENLNYILDNIGEWLQYNKDVADSQITAGDGLDSDAGTIGEGQTLSLGTPSTLDGLSSNEATGITHTHALNIASTAESQAGTDDVNLMTPSKVNDEIDMVGFVSYAAFSTTPSGRWLKCNGAAVSRTAYSALFAKIGTLYGEGDGSTTFNLPDARGEFIRCADDGRGIDSGRSVGSYQLDSVQEMTGSINTIMDGSSGTFERNSGTGPFTTENNSTNSAGTGSGTGVTARTMIFDNSLVQRTSSETRPRNIALMAWIRY